MSELGAARALVHAALAALEASRRRIDDLNVYPVPDGDTGTNLTLTVRAVAEAVDASEAAGRAAIVRELTRAALMGARGNSGVILSQIVRGAAEALPAEGAVDAGAIAAALRGAADTAYRAVRTPVEGTMLTIVRELAEEAERRAPFRPEPPALLAALVRHGEDALARTPEQLEVLREAGVVDAGGAGLLELVRGVAHHLTGEPLPSVPAGERLSFEAVHREASRYRYCTVFVVEGTGLDRAHLERELEPLGDSLLVVGDDQALKVHVHTDDPGAALALGTVRGTVDGVEVANMHRQTAEREQRLAGASSEIPPPRAKACEAVAVVAGEGNRRLFAGLGAGGIVEGGQTMNPSTRELVAAVEAAAAPEVVLLPNNPNVVMSAEQAASHAPKPVRVVPTRSLQEGLAAMVAYDPSLGAAANAEAMTEALAGVATGAVTIASRDARLNGVAVREGAWLGLAGADAVATGDGFEEVARAVVARLLAEPRDVLTLLLGAERPDVEALRAHLAERYPDVEVEVHEGGQPHYPLLAYAE